MQEEVPKLKTQLAETKGIFKGRERKELETKIQRTEEKISAMLEELPEILKEDGYPDVRAFMATYRKAEAVVEQYNRELVEWERKVREKGKPAEKEQAAPPRRESVLKRLRQLQAEGRTQKSKCKTPTWNDSFHIENNTAGFLRCIHRKCAPWLPSTGRMVIWIYLLYFLLRL